MTSVLAQALAAGRASLNDQTSERADALPVRYLSVCSGIEAATVAWHALGWTPAAFSEIEAFPRAVLAHRFPAVPLHGDFTTIEGGEYGPVDLLVGGTPCQSFSVAGLRKGLADDRGNLALQFLALAERTGARWVLWENVPGVLSSNGGRDFGAFLGGLAELGYGWAYRVLDAQHFGVPQRRRRVFVVGYLGDWRRAAAVLFERHSLQGNPPPRRETGERVAGTLETSTHDWSRNEPGAGVVHSLRADGFDASEDGTGRGTPLIATAYRTAGDGAVFDEGELTAPLTTGTDPSAQIVAFSSKDHGADAGDLAPTLRAMGHDGSHANAGGQVAIAFDTTQITSPQNRNNPKAGDPCHPLAAHAHAPAIAAAAVRRLTPRECERLQGFPDDWTQVPYRGNAAADGPRYKAIGNSMAVPCMRWIGERIAEVEAFDRVVAELPGIPDDAKTRRACISMFKPSGFPSVDAPNNHQPGGSTFNQVRVGVGLHANDFNTEA